LGKETIYAGEQYVTIKNVVHVNRIVNHWSYR
jgi:hypothetical protein